MSKSGKAKEKGQRRSNNQLANRDHHETLAYGSKRGKKMEPIVNKSAVRRQNKIDPRNWQDY